MHDAQHIVFLVHHGKNHLVGMRNHIDQFFQVFIGRNRQVICLNDGVGVQIRKDVGIFVACESVSFSSQILHVYRMFFKSFRNSKTDRGDNHQRNHQVVTSRYFRNKKYRGQGSVKQGAEDSGHSHHSEIADWQFGQSG